MLKTVTKAPTSEFIDWLEIERIQGRDIDIGMKRHWLDPTIPLNDRVFSPAHGIVITSATLKENTTNPENNWVIANKRTGVNHIRTNLTQVDVESPFDYAEQTQVLIINDVNRNDVDQVAAAYRELFIASHGGALGLFTAIQRLRAVHKKILNPLDQSGLKLYAQHVDGLSLSTLIDIFRMEENSSLLGTNAARDGVDIPGDSLRLIVFDKVPWPRPTILTKARQGSFGRNVYTDMLTKMKLTQAFGRLIRTTSDKGVFILLDSGMPSRLLDAFPKDATINRCGLADAIKNVKNFLNS
jgi:ATP-dependent DNA helicase DinG